MQYRTFAPRSQDTDPYTTLETYRLTRAAWFALYAPDAGRHDLLLADDVPSVYRNLFDAILDGNRGLARIAAAGGDELALLDVVARLPRPRQIPTRRLELPDNPDLAAALFGPVAGAIARRPRLPNRDMLPRAETEKQDAGTGEWPAAPPHTCEGATAVGTVLTRRPERPGTMAARAYNPTWHDCDGCRYERAKRISQQVLGEIHSHGPLCAQAMTEDDYKRWAARMRQYRRRTGATVNYRAMPQGDGWTCVIATAGSLPGALLPTDRAALLEIVMEACNTPEGHHISGSHGFGGDWQGTRGDGRIVAAHRAEAKNAGTSLSELRAEKRRNAQGAVQVWTDASLEQVGAAVGKKVKGEAETTHIAQELEEVVDLLKAKGHKVYNKRGAGQSVTNFAHQGEEEECAKCVTSTQAAAPPPPPIAPLLWPTEHATAGKEAAPCAISFQ